MYFHIFKRIRVLEYVNALKSIRVYRAEVLFCFFWVLFVQPVSLSVVHVALPLLFLFKILFVSSVDFLYWVDTVTFLASFLSKCLLLRWKGRSRAMRIHSFLQKQCSMVRQFTCPLNRRKKQRKGWKNQGDIWLSKMYLNCQLPSTLPNGNCLSTQ